MDQNNTHPINGDGLPSGSESRSSFDFELKWGVRKRLRCVKHNVDSHTNSSGAQPAVDRLNSNGAGEANGGGDGHLLGSEKRVKIEPEEGIRVKKEEPFTYGAGSCSSGNREVAEVKKMLANFGETIGEMWKSMDGKVDGLVTRLDIVEKKIMSDLARLREEMKASH